MSSEPLPARRTKFDIKREATIAELTRIGVEWFPTRGFRGVSLREVAKEAGVTTGALYFHFPSKEHFFVEAMHANDELRGEWWLAASDPANGSLYEAVADAIARMDAHSNQQGATWLPAMLEFDLIAHDKPELHEVLQEFYERWVGEMESFISLAGARGWVRDDMTTREAAEHVLSMQHGYWIQYGFFQFVPADLVDMTVRILQP